MAAQSSILAWRILWTEEPGGLLSIGSQSWTRLRRLSMHTCMQPHSCLCKAPSSLLVMRGCMHAKSLQSCPTLVTPMDCSPPESMGFSRQEYWSGVPCPSPAGLPNPGIKLASLSFPTWEAGSLPLVPPGKPSRHLGAPVNLI